MILCMSPLVPSKKNVYVRPELQDLGKIAELTLGSPGSITCDNGNWSMDQGTGNDSGPPCV